MNWGVAVDVAITLAFGVYISLLSYGVIAMQPVMDEAKARKRATALRIMRVCGPFIIAFGFIQLFIALVHP